MPPMPYAGSAWLSPPMKSEQSASRAHAALAFERLPEWIRPGVSELAVMAQIEASSAARGIRA